MNKNWSMGLMFALLTVAGCASARQSQIYPLSYDQTYQTTLDALDGFGQWRVLETDQLKGLIVLEKGGYFMPRRNATVRIERVAAFKTRVELVEDPSSKMQGEFFEAIDQRVSSRRNTYPS